MNPHHTNSLPHMFCLSVFLKALQEPHHERVESGAMSILIQILYCGSCILSSPDSSYNSYDSLVSLPKTVKHCVPQLVFERLFLGKKVEDFPVSSVKFHLVRIYYTPHSNLLKLSWSHSSYRSTSQYQQN